VVKATDLFCWSVSEQVVQVAMCRGESFADVEKLVKLFCSIAYREISVLLYLVSYVLEYSTVMQCSWQK